MNSLQTSFFKSKLARSLLLYVLLSSGIITTVTIGVDLALDYQNQVRVANDTVDKIINTSKKVLERSLWEMNVVALETQMDAILHDDAIQALMIIGAAVQIDERFKLPAQGQCDKIVRKDMNIVHPVTSENMKLGELVVCESYQNIVDSLSDRLIRISILQVLKSLAMSFVILLIVYTLVVRYLLVIVEYMGQVEFESDNQNELRLERGKRQDELTTLENTINIMLGRLSQSFVEKKHLVKDLELDRDKLKKSIYKNNYLLAAIEQDSDAIFMLDEEGRVEYGNKAFVRKCCLVEKSRLNKAYIGDLISVEKGLEYISIIHNLMPMNAGAFEDTYDVHYQNGTLRSIVKVVPIETNGILTFICIHRDLTKYLALEQKYYQAQKINALGSMLGGIAHDFNNLLAALIANLYLLRRKVGDTPESEKHLDAMDRITGSGTEMIQKLMSFARNEKLDMKIFDINAYIQEVVHMYQVSIPASIQLETRWHMEPVFIKGDAGRLQQIVMNVVNNAVYAMQGVENPVLKIRTSVEEREGVPFYFYLSISDTGCGMDEKTMAKVFDPFFTSKPMGSGTGLGLATAFATAEEHGGFIRVESRMGVGSTFHVYIPLSKEDEKSQRSVTKEYQLTLSETILIIEDNDDFRAAMGDMLEEEGCKVLQAERGDVGIEMYERYQSDIGVVFVDLVMPGMQGREVQQALQRIDEEVNVIFMTGYDAQFANEVGGNGSPILRKPMSINTICTAIRKVLDR